jgi:hypothetical protein
MASRHPVFALATFLLLAGEAVAAQPDYIRAKPQELAAAYGQAVADRAFSDEFTDLRKNRIEGSLTRIPGLKCPAPTFVLYDLYPFQGEPGEVIWIERYEVDCGKPLRRAIAMVLTGDRIEAAAMAPGATLADAQLQIETGRLASQAALARAPEGCKEAPVIDTAVTEKPTTGGPPWKERWTTNACGEIVEVELHFMPSPTGGTLVRASGE